MFKKNKKKNHKMNTKYSAMKSIPAVAHTRGRPKGSFAEFGLQEGGLINSIYNI